MANEALNPFQQFFDDGGRELARGTIEFFTDSGRTTQLTIYEDSDLTTAQSNPYTLDAFGRVRGDVRYEGQATLVITNADGLEIRQLDEVVSANDGQLGSVTIMKESVAKMVTDEALEEGQLVRTRGYYSPNRYGGARYIIVAAGTGSADDFRYHNLNNGLQAELLDLEQNMNFLVAGALGDGGSNDTDPMQAVINIGGDIHVPEGFTFMATNLAIASDVRFSGGGAMKQLGASSGDLFQITSISVKEVKFRAVILDGNQIQGNDGNATVGWVLTSG